MLTHVQIVALRPFSIILGISLMILLIAEGGHAMQPPPPPLDAAQLRMLVSEADVVVVGKIGEVRETEKTVVAALKVEKLLKGKVLGKTIVIEETFKPLKFQLPDVGSEGEGEPNKNIVSSIAGPSTYHGSYEKGKRIVVLLKKIEGTETYRPLGSGTYNKYLCEFLIEDAGIKTVYFKFADDVKQYAGDEKKFIRFIKRMIDSN
jgi:hypothetical protein